MKATIKIDACETCDSDLVMRITVMGCDLEAATCCSEMSVSYGMDYIVGETHEQLRSRALLVFEGWRADMGLPAPDKVILSSGVQ